MNDVIQAKPSPRAVSISTEPGSILSVTCQDGSVLRVDLTGWIELAPSPSPFHRLRDPVVFSRAAIIDYGLTIEWDGDEDLVIDTIHLELLAAQQAEFGAADLVAWQARHNLSNREAADLVDVHVNTWINYRRPGARIPRPVSIALRAMDQDPTILSAFYRPVSGGRTSSVSASR